LPYLLSAPHTISTLHSFPTRRSSDLRVTTPAENESAGSSGDDARTKRQSVREELANLVHEALRPWIMPIPIAPADLLQLAQQLLDRKSTRLNSSHLVISYAVFCLKKK